MSIPMFAVVGHPNKGKSSIVATLAHNDAIEISKQSGTTTQTNNYRVKTENGCYQLSDTPGFQRPNKVLNWLKQKATSADLRADAVRQFVADESCRQNFVDEVELLAPIINGAAILYVVDGSRPYSIDYEAEMEILQWTGQPSMALINPIQNDQHVDSWKNALMQYFKTVRIFNPMEAEFNKQLELLKVFTHLETKWFDQLSRVISDLEKLRVNQNRQSIIIATRLLEDLCLHRVSQKVVNKDQAKLLEPALKTLFQKWMLKREKQSINELLTLYSFSHTQLQMDDLTLPPDLFDCEQWYLWGLTKNQLSTTAAITGAAAGAAIDLAVAGSSLMAGAIGGALLGFGSAWFGADQLLDLRVVGLPVGGYEACFGPISNKNFPYVILGRFLYLHQQISNRNHALRNSIELQEINLNSKIEKLEKSVQKELHVAFQNLSQQKVPENLQNCLQKLF